MKQRTRIRSAMFLALIYTTFISLGLPDSLLGTSWPVMQTDFNVPYSYAGIASMVIAGGTIIASFLSGQLLRQWSTSSLTLTSVAATAVALFGFSRSPSFGWIILMAIPLGLGAGAVDAALNHFVARHYKAHHMNWPHCFWGVGAMTGPMIMAPYMAHHGNWQGGYLVVSIIQTCLVAILFASIPLWRRMETGPASLMPTGDTPHVPDNVKTRNLWRLPGIGTLLMTFILYCGIEATMALWGGSYLVQIRGFDVVEAAYGVSLLYGALTLGRFLSGFVSMKLSSAQLIRIGLLTVVAGAVFLFLPATKIWSYTGFALIGLGTAPIFPALLHETPNRYGDKWAPTLMGVQMAAAFTGATFLPPLFGLVTGGSHLWLLPVVALLYAGVMIYLTEVRGRIVGKAVRPLNP